MILYGKLIKRNMPLKTGEIVNNDFEANFHDAMEASFILLCKELDIPVPIWLAKNTREISRYRKTYFNHEQFIEKVYFDKFVLEIEV